MKLPPSTDFSAIPIILTLQDMSALYRISPLTIRRQLSDNTFRPLPFEKYPYRWLREEVMRDLQARASAQGRAKLKTRRHGFAATKAKRLAAEKLATK